MALIMMFWALVSVCNLLVISFHDEMACCIVFLIGCVPAGCLTAEVLSTTWQQACSPPLWNRAPWPYWYSRPGQCIRYRLCGSSFQLWLYLAFLRLVSLLLLQSLGKLPSFDWHIEGETPSHWNARTCCRLCFKKELLSLWVLWLLPNVFGIL